MGARVTEPGDASYHVGMSQIRITREALEEVQRALAVYEELLASLEQTRVIKESTRQTYMVHSDNFVRWMRGEFDPGARNKA